MAKRGRRRHSVHLFSDSSGNLIEHLIGAVLTQFPEKAFGIVTHPFMNTESLLRRTVSRIDKGIVCHALVDPKLKALITVECARRQLRCADVTGPTVQFLEAATGLRAALVPKPVHVLDARYMGRMAALEFAMQHDDNRRLERLGDAEVVLVGVSRVSKSPNAIFLAYRGYRVANVALVPSEGLPSPLKRHRRRNVVALTMQPRRLAEIRRERFAGWDLGDFAYADMQAVIHEVRDAATIYEKRRWPVIDTTNRAIEETSTLILKALNLRSRIMRDA